MIERRMASSRRLSRAVCLLLALGEVSAFAPGKSSTRRSPFSFPTGTNAPFTDATRSIPSLDVRGGGGSSSTSTFLVGPTFASLLAGSVAGAIGVGAAFPLDTLKTKSQVLGQQKVQPGTSPNVSSDGAAAVSVASASLTPNNKLGMLDIIRLIYEQEGLSGFFGGVRAMMLGQAIIKAMAFSANTNALNLLQPYTHVLSSVGVLILAACFSGFITSFLVAPVERIKVMMQASGNSLYRNELDCLKAVLRAEGLEGLMGRGLGATLAREIPSYGIYFVIYGILMQSSMATVLGPAAPLVFGALSGCACWIPVYPVDVVKTLIQNTEGQDSKEEVTTWQVTRQLYQQGGVGAFFDGLTPKMLRAAVNHSVTFFIYDLVLQALTD